MMLIEPYDFGSGVLASDLPFFPDDDDPQTLFLHNRDERVIVYTRVGFRQSYTDGFWEKMLLTTFEAEMTQKFAEFMTETDASGTCFPI